MLKKHWLLNTALVGTFALAMQLSSTSSALAQGVPVGGELDYLDDGTITAALNARKAL